MSLPRYASLFLVLAVVTAGCATPERTTGPGRAATPPSAPSPAEAPPPSDVTLDGVSILGAWYAVEVIGDSDMSEDLRAGTLEMTLIVGPNGRATLTGNDRREGSGPVTFSGRITDNRIVFEGMDGAGTLLMNGRRLVLRDPRGRSTAYIRTRD
ncbi:MAG: hypothetical protein HKN04_09180 [Rhodothermaceae bacterium]|nr:hypothetical protein [Rhodothermaceae bacterium]